MEYRRLGNSGLQVSAFSLGSWLTFGSQIDNDIAEQLMIAAYEAGINFFDNAEIYAHGRSEIVMGEILKKLNWDRTSYTVSSKVFFGDGRKLPNQTGLSRKHVFEACDAALKRLQLDYIDLYFCHRPDPNTPIIETVWAMNHLIQQGKVLYWGTSEWSAQQITEAHYAAQRYHLIGPTMEQPQYNMLHRERFEVEYEPIYKNFGLGTTIWSPLASGLLSGKYNNGMPSDNTRLQRQGLDWLREQALQEVKLAKVRQLTRIAQNLDISMPVLALAWCLKNPNVSTVILGASKLTQLTENLKALDAVPLLTTEIMEAIDKVLA
ncbi:MAG: aldo/keto reductase [Sphingobacteriales bacterium]|jgi:voltage-dependent potassium channel beta subunit|nr:aldo/keto reductase [Sphingobacteriales bacterium]MBP9141813.1 aldo/keto reductase [Chitinophagales bacterium]MDA0198183.1 aldo/keto reductase [Bacteroidota bacterium]MBK6889508.1 aldo/keto reductase [Sphingobacteriales bacterium]MBK7527989.1 aldo/keto reductase [Sphingobacteriales bacterium]